MSQVLVHLHAVLLLLLPLLRKPSILLCLPAQCHCQEQEAASHWVCSK
jgi:hypothetical protein